MILSIHIAAVLIIVVFAAAISGYKFPVKLTAKQHNVVSTVWNLLLLVGIIWVFSFALPIILGYWAV
jgi:hypothetical protein